MPTLPSGDEVVDTSNLFRPLLVKLIELLRGLAPGDWSQPTSAGAWSVKDVAAHLLDGDLRRISIHRDGHLPPPPSEPITGYNDLLRYLNTLNAEWINVARRLSPGVLCDFLEISGFEVAALMEGADPTAEATFPVAWAGQSRSAMWMDIGREYTERWHHQDQIREAVGAPPLQEEPLLRPALEISLFALPHAYRDLSAEAGTAVHVNVTGKAGGDWHLLWDSGWHMHKGQPREAATIVRVNDLDLTRLLMHRIAPDRASGVLEVQGDPQYATPLIAARAVMV